MFLASLSDPTWIELIVSVFGILAAWGLRALAAKQSADSLLGQLESAAGVAAQRAKDKYLADIIAARDATSDGGAVVTPAELSLAREHALAVLKASAVDGPLLQLIQTKGEAWVKGLIGQKLDGLLSKLGVSVGSLTPGLVALTPPMVEHIPATAPAAGS